MLSKQQPTCNDLFSCDESQQFNSPTNRSKGSQNIEDNDDMYRKEVFEHRRRQKRFEEELDQEIQHSDIQYGPVALWIIEFPERLYYQMKWDLISSEQNLINRLDTIKGDQGELSAKILHDNIPWAKYKENLNKWMVQARDQFFIQYLKPDQATQCIINQLVSKQMQILLDWEFTLDDLYNQYKNRYLSHSNRKPKQSNSQSIKQKWIKVYPDRIFALVIQQKSQLLVKFQSLIEELLLKFQECKLACLNTNIVKNVTQSLHYNYKMQNVKVTKNMLKSSIDKTDWNSQDQECFKKLMFIAFENFENSQSHQDESKEHFNLIRSGLSNQFELLFLHKNSCAKHIKLYLPEFKEIGSNGKGS